MILYYLCVDVFVINRFKSHQIMCFIFSKYTYALYTHQLTMWAGGHSLGLSWYPVLYRQTSNISHTVIGNKIVDHSDVVGASSVSAAPSTSSFLT